MYLNRDMDGGPFLVYFLPILGGQKAAVLDSVEGWCAAGNLGASRVSTGRMDRWTTGWMTNGWMKIYLFCLDGWTGWMMGWMTGRIQEKLHFSSRCPLQYIRYIF